MNLILLFIIPVMLLIVLEEGSRLVFHRYVFGPSRFEIKMKETGAQFWKKRKQAAKNKTRSKKNDS